MTIRDEDALNAYLDERPDDVITRCALADLLEEQGRKDDARVQRWLAENKKHPHKCPNEVTDETGWCWWNEAHPYSTTLDCVPFATIPDEMDNLMPQGRWLRHTRREAEDLLIKPLAALDRSLQQVKT